MPIYVIRYEYIDKSGNGVVGVFDDEEIANNVYDALDQYAGDSSKTFFIDTFKLNEVTKGN